MKAMKLCDKCNSPVVTVKRGKKVSVECSYCGQSYNKEASIEDFLSNYDGENNEE